MTRITVLALLATMFCTAHLPAQEPAGPAKAAPARVDNLTALGDAVQQLQADIGDLSSEYVTREEFLKLQDNVTKLAGGLENLRSIVSEQADRIEEMDLRYNDAVRQLNIQADDIEKIVQAISQMDNGKPILRLSNSMESAVFQDEFRKSVDDTLPRTRARGRLVVLNYMGAPQVLRINGREHVIPAYPAETPIDVEAGTLTTELAGEAPKNWTIAAPKYEQRIMIVPRQPSYSPIYLTGY